MKLCPSCHQAVGDPVAACPSCGSAIGAGRTHIDGYRILQVLQEGHASLLCQAVHEASGERVMIRLFTASAEVDEKVARRLQQELERLEKIPGSGFVRHQAIRQSSDGLWYRVSEWVDAESWGSLLASGKLGGLPEKLRLFRQIASSLGTLHKHGHIIPHLTLNDVMAVREEDGRLRARIDYKLSRFLDPEMTRPGKMLKQLLALHPDIVNQRPLEARSDVWSLGKLLVEVLAGDLDIENHEATVDDLNVPEELKVLLRVMLADDPFHRPQSMDEISDVLSRIERKVETEPLSSPARSIRRLQERVRLLALGVIGIAVLGALAWYFAVRDTGDPTLEDYANRYAASVAFVLVDYWVEAKGQVVYRNAAEGTAFLADDDGHLLTSRHVVCPWLEDPQLLHGVSQLLEEGIVPKLGHEIYLWFEGQRAFNPTGSLLGSEEMADYFLLESAFSTAEPARLSIVGVARPPVRARQLIASPLKDDVAVIKVDELPAGLTPLPLDAAFDPFGIPRLSRVIALGFPLGSTTQAQTVNASAVDGHVRRSFRNMLQIDSSLHGGNSGGPIVDSRGKVIGIVAAVAVEPTGGLLGGMRPLGDIGLILPITGGAELLAEVKAGRMKWKGELDFSLAATLERIRNTALEGRWAEARALAEQELERSPQAELLTACGMLATCTGDEEGARLRFQQLLSMNPEDGGARLMLFLLDWLMGAADDSPHRDELLRADWRSPNEFAGYLARLIDGSVEIEAALEGWHDRPEKSWLHLVAGMMRARKGDASGAEELLRTAVRAADSDSWALYLALARLEQAFDNRRVGLQAVDERGIARDPRGRPRDIDDETLRAMRSREGLVRPLREKLARRGLSLEDRIALLESLREAEPDDLDVRAALAFYHAAGEDWLEALENIEAFDSVTGRMSRSRLSLGLLEAAILHHRGMQSRAQAALADYRDQVEDELYLAIGDLMRGDLDAKTLKSRAARRPEDLLIANALTGFWAEGSGDRERAQADYRAALGSFLDDWLEYDFARVRRQRLRQAQEED